MGNINIENLTIQTTINKSTFLSCNNVSLDIEDNEVYGVVGSSGAGKSLLARFMTATLGSNSRILSGEGNINGEPITRTSSRAVLLNRESIQKYNKNKDLSNFDKFELALSEIMNTNPDVLVVDFPTVLRNEQAESFTECIKNLPDRFTVEQFWTWSASYRQYLVDPSKATHILYLFSYLWEIDEQFEPLRFGPELKKL